MASANAPSAMESQQRTSAKTNDKIHSSGRMVSSSGISDVVIASVLYSVKNRPKKLKMMLDNDY